MRIFNIFFLALLLLLCLAACLPNDANRQTSDKPPIAVEGVLPQLGEYMDWSISIVDSTGAKAWSFTEAELISALEPAEPFSHAYSTINNWPATRFYAAEGYKVSDILKAAGLYESAQTITFSAIDGYQVSLTAKQLLCPQYYYPQVGENSDSAEQVFPIIAYRWREGTAELEEIYENKPCLIIGQSNHLEHTNPAFVVGLSAILVTDSPSEQWPIAGAFPLPGSIAAGETVKLQHPDYGLVKLHYTLDGSKPTTLSPIYNPSTYQPELNRPIPITKPTTIKVLVSGYGKTDSEIAVFDFFPLESK